MNNFITCVSYLKNKKSFYYIFDKEDKHLKEKLHLTDKLLGEICYGIIRCVDYNTNKELGYYRLTCKIGERIEESSLFNHKVLKYHKDKIIKLYKRR